MSKGKILTVDDSRLARRAFVAKPLMNAGYEVVEAQNGEEGLQVFLAHQPDLVISDLLMPKMDGFEFVQKLHEFGGVCPIIVASADIQDSSREQIEELGTFGFLNKPFKSGELLLMVSSALCASQTRQESS